MPDQPKKFYLTTPIYYVNARPHIGHAYTTIAADVLARRHRLLGEDVFFLTGTDEHGQKIERSAAAAGIPPQQFADEVAASFAALWQRMGITNDKFIRTTSPEHKRGVQKLWRELESRGAIYLDSYTGAYCVPDETFVDLPAGTPCPDCGRPLEIVTEENYFFRLSAYQEQLINLIESNTLNDPLRIEPEARRNEVLSFLRGNWMAELAQHFPTAKEHLRALNSWDDGVNPTVEEMAQYIGSADSGLHGRAKKSKLGNFYVPGALKDLSISRTSFQWGIPVPPPANNSPGAPSMPESHPGMGGKEPSPRAPFMERSEVSGKQQDHIIYVWLDALVNYVSAIGYGSDAPEDIAHFEKYWPADLHLVGKEIIRFHCVYWPAFLLAAGIPLPKKIQAHGWLLFEESKMSKSRGNIVRTETILDAFGDHYRASLAAHNKKLAADPIKSEVDAAQSTGDVARSPTAAAQSAVILSQSEAAAQNLRISSLAPEPTKRDCDLFAADVLRYFLLREIPFGQDGSFSFDALWERYNADLVNGYGNLVSRTLKQVEQRFAAQLPCKDRSDWNEQLWLEHAYLQDNLGGVNVSPRIEVSKFNLAQIDTSSGLVVSLQGTMTAVITHCIRSIDLAQSIEQGHNFSAFLSEIQLAIRMTDGYLTLKAPWKLAEDKRGEIAEILYIAAESIRIITTLLHPIMPHTTGKVWAQLGLDPADLDSTQPATSNQQLAILSWGGLKPGTKLGPLAPIFPRAPKELAQVMSDIELQNNPAKPAAESAAVPATPPPGIAPLSEKSVESVSSVLNSSSEPVPTTPLISIDDFAKVDLRVARVLVAERIPKADKLLRLEVDLGPSFNPPTRQILAGIAQYYQPEKLIGRKVVIVANLAPRKMRGLESQGMVVAASIEPDGSPVLAAFLEDVEIGARLK